MVYSKSLLPIHSLLHSESVFVSGSRVYHPSSTAYPGYCTPKCSCPWFLFFCCSNLVTVTRYSVISAKGKKAEDSRCDKEPKSTFDKEVKSDTDQTFPQNKPDSSKCEALSGGLAPSFIGGQINMQSQNSLRSRFPSEPSSVLTSRPGSSQLQTLGQYLDFSLAGGARAQWPCRPH